MFLFKLKNTPLLFISLTLLFSPACSSTKKTSEFDYTEEEAEQYKDKEKTEDAYYVENEIRMEDRVYRETIRTDQLHPEGEPLKLPIISLQNGPALEFKFDDMVDDREDYFYRIYHCNADWTRSDLLPTEYIQGFFSNAIVDQQFSFGTLRRYVHYSATFPNNSLLLTKSGNYVVAVTLEDNEEAVVLTKRFMVVDERVAIVPNVRQTAVVQERDFKQLVDFEIHHASFDIGDPFRDIKTVVMQNQRWDNAKTDLKPVFIRDRILQYRYESGNDFWGGNEYRRFNVSSMRFASDRIRDVTRLEDRFFVNLATDQKRNIGNYFSIQDVNGQFLIKNADGFDDDAESDYADVHFELAMNSPLRSGSVYITGGLTNYRADKRFQMRWSPELKAYECTVPLKQGYYEYLYMVANDYSDELDVLPIEGSHYETDNDYTVLVYYRDIRNDYDELIGSLTFAALDFF